jgi:penicillin amidase
MRRFGVLLLAFSLSAFGESSPELSLAERARAVLATLSGQLRVPGLHHPVSVQRDHWGVAHIYAGDAHDLFFAQGFVAAQDRLFQMEMWKRSGQGRLSEVLGPSTVERDVNARRLKYRGDMRAEYASYAPDTEAILTAFTDGINAYIASRTATDGGGLPIEFLLARFAPEPWRPEDCLNRMAAFSMTGNADRELYFARAIQDLGIARAISIMDFDPPVPATTPKDVDLHGLGPKLLEHLVGSDQRIEFPKRNPEGSNNWTIAGSQTVSGMPLLANDPHRVLALPSLRYMVHLVAPGWNVIGAGEPGLPGVALGHNEQVAWGFTIFGLDQQDLYVEDLNPANPLEYKIGHGWRRMETRKELVPVKGEAPRAVELKFTVHGPVLWEDGKRALALKWVGAEPGTAGYLASLSIDRVRSWAEFEAAVPRWKVPSENLVYADKDGNIGEHSAGLAPKRRWNGALPVSGRGEFEWSGFVPADQLPHDANPVQGFIATANHRMIPEHYPYHIGVEWDPGFREARIREVLGGAARAGHKLTIADLEALQSDDQSLPALELQRIVRVSDLRNEPQLAGFLAWDAHLGRASADGALYEAWIREIDSAIAARLFPSAPKRYTNLSPRVLLRILADATPGIFGPPSAASRDRLLRDALSAAQADLSKTLGADPAKWSWGALHVIRFRHSLDALAETAALFDLGPLARPGDGYTVNSTYGEPAWEQAGGASYREILDPGDWDCSVAVNTPGQSGQPGSPHYADLMPLWDAGQYFPLLFSPATVASHTDDRLELVP